MNDEKIIVICNICDRAIEFDYAGIEGGIESNIFDPAVLGKILAKRGWYSAGHDTSHCPKCRKDGREQPLFPPDFVYNELFAEACTYLMEWLKKADAPAHVDDLFSALQWAVIYHGEWVDSRGTVSADMNREAGEIVPMGLSALEEMGKIWW